MSTTQVTGFLDSTTGKLVLGGLLIGGVFVMVSFSPLGKVLGAGGKVADTAADALEWTAKKGIPGLAKELKKGGKSIWKKGLKPAYKKGIKPAAKAIEKAGKKTIKSVKKTTKKLKKGVNKLFKIKK